MKVLALIDFSGYTVPVIKAAYHWCMLSGGEFHILHKTELMLPGFTSPEIKKKWGEDAEKNIVVEVNELLKSAIGAVLPEDQIHVTAQRLLPFVSKIITKNNIDLIFVGVKGNDILKNVFIGNTGLKLIDNFSVPVATIPKRYVLKTPLNIYVAVHQEYGFPMGALSKLMKRLMVHSIQIISVVENKDDYLAYEEYLKELSSFFPKVDCSYKLFEGNVFEQLKNLMANHKNAMLVVQKGSRAYSDMVFRKFLVNELVYDADVPLIVLP